MNLDEFRHNEQAGLSLGRISGTRDELIALRDKLDHLLATSEGDTRRHTCCLDFPLIGLGLMITVHNGDR